MRVQISKWGNSLAVRLPKGVVDTLELKPGKAFELVVEGRDLRLMPAFARPEYKIEDLVAEMRRLGPENAPGLEDWTAAQAPWPALPTATR